jgi:hypothetical protein
VIVMTHETFIEVGKTFFLVRDSGSDV